jgi:hypothetical protein
MARKIKKSQKDAALIISFSKLSESPKYQCELLELLWWACNAIILSNMVRRLGWVGISQGETGEGGFHSFWNFGTSLDNSAVGR